MSEPTPTPTGAASEVEVRVPDIGDFEDVEVVEVLVAAGDRVALEDPLVSIESDKATMEIPSPHAGVVMKLAVAVGDLVSEGSLLLTLELAPEDARPAPLATPVLQDRPAPASEPTPAPPPPARRPGDPPPSLPPLATDPTPGASPPHASPLIRKMARELGVELGSVTDGSGPRGRILREDVQAHVRGALAGGGGAAGFGAQHDEADVTRLEAFAESHAEKAARQGRRLTLLPFLVKACAQALRSHRELGSDARGGEGFALEGHGAGIDIGVAMQGHAGLVFPVLRDADRKGLLELAGELEGLAEGARADDGVGDFDGRDLPSRGFALASLGEIGGTHSTPVLRSSQVAVLGTGRIQTRAVWREEGDADEAPGFVPRRLLPLSLAYPARACDAAAAARFVAQLRRSLESIEQLLL